MNMVQISLYSASTLSTLFIFNSFTLSCIYVERSTSSSLTQVTQAQPYYSNIIYVCIVDSVAYGAHSAKMCGVFPEGLKRPYSRVSWFSLLFQWQKFTFSEQHFLLNFRLLPFFTIFRAKFLPQCQLSLEVEGNWPKFLPLVFSDRQSCCASLFLKYHLTLSINLYSHIAHFSVILCYNFSYFML